MHFPVDDRLSPPSVCGCNQCNQLVIDCGGRRTNKSHWPKAFGTRLDYRTLHAAHKKSPVQKKNI